MSRGYFEIGICSGKAPVNVGTLWRSAYQFGAAGIFTIGRRYPAQTSDTTKTYRHVALREFLTFEDFLLAQPYGCQLVGVEMGGRPLREFTHPQQCIYLLGAEDKGISKQIMDQCQHIVSIPSIRTESFNVAVAGSIVMYDRLSKSK